VGSVNCKTHRKNGFVERCKNLTGYRSENNFGRLSK